MLELWRYGSQSERGRKVIFRRKAKELPKREIEFQVNVIGAEALHIKRTGSYILQLDQNIPMVQVDEMTKKLKASTGANWVIVLGGARVVKCHCHG
jgi:hypothetical protein